MRRLIFFLVMVWLFLTNTCLAEPIKLAIVPFVDSAFSDGSASGDWVGFKYKELLDNTISEKSAVLFPSSKYEIVPVEQVQSVLIANGYDIDNLDYPDKITLINIAKNTKADLVMAIEIMKFNQSISFDHHFFTTFRGRIYDSVNDKYATIKIDYDSNTSGSIFNSQHARAKKNVPKVLENALNKLFNRFNELGFDIPYIK